MELSAFSVPHTPHSHGQGSCRVTGKSFFPPFCIHRVTHGLHTRPGDKPCPRCVHYFLAPLSHSHAHASFTRPGVMPCHRYIHFVSPLSLTAYDTAHTHALGPTRVSTTHLVSIRWETRDVTRFIFEPCLGPYKVFFFSRSVCVSFHFSPCSLLFYRTCAKPRFRISFLPHAFVHTYCFHFNNQGMTFSFPLWISL